MKCVNSSPFSKTAIEYSLYLFIASSGAGSYTLPPSSLAAELAQMKSMLMAREPDSPSGEAGVSDPPMPHLTLEEDTLPGGLSHTLP